MKIIDIINNRHSYRGKYKPISVPREDLITIMQAGLNAPSGCNKQTTSLIAVDDKDILQKLHNVINPPVGETAPAIICVLTQRINAYSLHIALVFLTHSIQKGTRKNGNSYRTSQHDLPQR